MQSETPQLTPLENGEILRIFNSDKLINNYDIDFNALILHDNKKEIPIKLLEIINNFNDYLDYININNNINIIDNLLKLFIEQKEKNRFDVDLISFILTSIKNNIDNAITYYKHINQDKNNEFFSSNSMIQYFFVYSIFKSITILYTYICYLKFIYDYINELNKYNLKSLLIYILDAINSEYSELVATIITSHINEDEFREGESNEDLKEINIENETIDDKIKELNETDKLNKTDTLSILSILSIIYKYICINFNKEIINIYSKKISYNLIKKNINRITDNQRKNNDDNYLKLIFELIITIFTIFEKIPKGNNNYITIPQYEGVCWYISMLTCMCYSDASKNLILSKISKSKSEIETKSESEKEFIDIVKYIITNITKDYREYNSENIESNCEFFLYFKNNLLNFLLYKIIEIKTKYNIESKMNNDTYIGNDDYYFIDIINIMIEYNITLNSHNLYKILAINKYGYLILNTLYKILDISTLFIYHIDIDTSLYIQEDKLSISSPDIIFIQNIPDNDTILTTNIKQSSNLKNISKSTIKYENENIIIYNKQKYKYEYILHMTNNHDKCNASGCGHCISGIHYKGEQYYYDSKYSEQNIKCSSEDIKIPCSLIKQDWNYRIDKINEKYFTINKCFLRNVDITKDALKIEKEHLSDEKMFFNKNSSLIRAYVKVDDSTTATAGGNNKNKNKNNKYKSTHKKINIMNKNNKIIERTIYINNNNNNNNKFIKLNKKFEQLSNFKFNKKNKYYYI